MKRVLVVTLVLTAAAGCSTSKSTLLSRNESNTGWNKIAHLSGTPITLRVPTHLRVYIYEKHFLEKTTVGGVVHWQKVEAGPMYDFGTELMYTEKIFTTDFKRPAAGMINLKVDYTDQYVDSVQQDITDQTIEKVGELVSRIPALFTPASGPADSASADTLKEVKSVLAANVFEIDDPNFEAHVTAFVQENLNSRTCSDTMPASITMGAQRPPVTIRR